LFRLNTDGTVDRKLAIIEIQRGGLTVIDEPPRSFAAGS
jgi:branched-chain amino acid transport system substrate-binding protein